MEISFRVWKLEVNILIVDLNISGGYLASQISISWKR